MEHSWVYLLEHVVIIQPCLYCPQQRWQECFCTWSKGLTFLAQVMKMKLLVSQAPILVGALLPFSSGFNNLFPTTFPNHRQMDKCSSWTSMWINRNQDWKCVCACVRVLKLRLLHNWNYCTYNFEPCFAHFYSIKSISCWVVAAHTFNLNT